LSPDLLNEINKEPSRHMLNIEALLNWRIYHYV